LSVAANKIAQVDYDPDFALLKEWAGEDEQIKKLFSDDEWREGTGEGKKTNIENNFEEENLKLSQLIVLQEKWGTKQNQLWRCGKHYVFCGDSTDKNKVDKLFDVSKKPDYLIYDPDWDEKINFPEYEWAGTIAYSDGLRAKDIIGKFGAPAWVFTWDGYTSWYTPNRPLKRAKYAFWYGDISQYNFNGAHYGDAGEEKQVKNTRGEYNFIPDPRGKHLSDVFSLSLPKLHSDGFHPYEKPLDWVRLLIGNCFAGNVFDPFCGSGNTMFACQQIGKSSVCIDLNPMYVANILEKMQKTGIEVNHVYDL